MSTKEKLLQKIENNPCSVTYDEMKALLFHLGFELSNKGKTSGSRVQFFDAQGREITLHKPHPQKEMRSYAVKDILQKLKEMKLI